MRPDDQQGTTPSPLPDVPPHLAGKFTPEQWARRQALAAKLTKFSTDSRGRPVAHAARVARRAIVFIFCGIAFLLSGLGAMLGVVHLSNVPPGVSAGWIRQHGGDLLAIALGICFLAAGIRVIAATRKLENL